MIRGIINREKFNPSFLGVFINPFYFARRGLYLNIKLFSHYIRGKVLDIGCGQKPYQYLFNSTEYIGLEIDTPENRVSKEADYFYDRKTFPFKNEEFDSVLATQVFEHIFEPGDFSKEINRVLKTNGTLLLTVPFVWDEHEQPFDYGRYTSFGIKSILEKCGFEVLEQRKNLNDIRIVFQMINAYFYKVFSVRKNTVKMALFAPLFAFFNILGLIFNLFFPKNDDLFLDNIIIARKKRLQLSNERIQLLYAF